MKGSLQPGLSFRKEVLVDESRCIGFMGREGMVYATPKMVSDVEYACRDWLVGHLDAGEDSVGTRVEIDHLAATLLGMKVAITATLAELKGRAAVFEVSATDGLDTICRGRHARFIANVDQVKQRLKQKQAKASSRTA
jgi:predicted thioesterase